jgi:hypothetical protein
METMPTTTRTRLLERHFYFFMASLIVVPVAYGFSFTVGQNLIHPAVPRPGILYLHAAVFTGWLVFFVLQTGLVRARKGGRSANSPGVPDCASSVADRPDHGHLHGAAHSVVLAANRARHSRLLSAPSRVMNYIYRFDAQAISRRNHLAHRSTLLPVGDYRRPDKGPIRDEAS